jgi:hypothetical protein
VKRVTTLVVAALAVVAISLVGVATASAAAKITYTGNGKFTASGGKGTLETVGGLTVVCQTNTGKGKLGTSPATTVTGGVVLFKECESAGKKCTTTGKTAGEIETKTLKATLGDTASGAEPGALLEPETGLVFAEFKCGTIVSKVEGTGVIGKLTPVGVKTKTLTLAFTQTKGVQALKHFFGEATEHFLKAELGKGLEEAGLAGSQTLTLEEGEGTLTA